MFKPDFGQSFFEKHQTKLVSFMNSRLGRWFFKLDKVGIARDFLIMEVRPDSVSGDWKYDMAVRKLVKTDVFFTSNRFQNRLEHVYASAARLVPSAIAWKAMQPLAGAHGALAFLPLLALTSSTFYSTSGTASPVDGYVDRNGVSESWATIHDATYGNDSNRNSALETNSVGLTMVIGAGNTFTTLGRTHTFFNTAALNDSATVVSATYSLFGTGTVTDTLTRAQSLVVVESSAASASTIHEENDYSTLGTTAYSSTKAISGWSTSAYNAFTLNATGLAAINLTGVTKFGCRYDDDRSNTTPGSGASTKAVANCLFADTAGDTNAPKLVVTYTTSTDTIVFDAASGISTASSSTTLTISHVVGSGSNRILFAAATDLLGVQTPTATYNGVAMTQLATVSSGSIRSTAFYLVAPATGTANIVFTFGSSTDIRGGGVSYAGAKQTGVPDASATGSSSSDPHNVAATVVIGNSWVWAYTGSSGGSISSIDNCVIRGTGGATSSIQGDSNGAVSAGSFTAGFRTASVANVGIVASFAPAVGGASEYINRLLRGIG